MKLHKLSVITALALGGFLAGALLAGAQTTNAPGAGNAKKATGIELQLEKASTELNLTDAQKPKVKVQLEEFATKRRALYADTAMPLAERTTKMEEANKVLDEKMKAILTPEQFAKWPATRVSLFPTRRVGGTVKQAP